MRYSVLTAEVILVTYYLPVLQVCTVKMFFLWQPFFLWFSITSLHVSYQHPEVGLINSKTLIIFFSLWVKGLSSDKEIALVSNVDKFLPYDLSKTLMGKPSVGHLRVLEFLFNRKMTLSWLGIVGSIEQLHSSDVASEDNSLHFFSVVSASCLILELFIVTILFYSI